MNAEDYLNKLEQKSKLEQDLKNLNKEIINLIWSYGEPIKETLKEAILDVFPKNSIELLSRKNWLDGTYKEIEKKIEYRFEMADYLANLYKGKFPNEVSKRARHEVKLYFEYHLIDNDFSAYLRIYGFEDKMLKSYILRDAHRELSWAMKDVFDVKHTSLEQIKENMSKIKNMMDNFESVMLANRLEKM